jgi:hypothetical protein
MNIETGEIKRFGSDEEFDREKFIEIQEDLMTKVQKATEQISKFDAQSELGKLFTGNRKERREREKLIKKLAKRSASKAVNDPDPYEHHTTPFDPSNAEHLANYAHL